MHIRGAIDKNQTDDKEAPLDYNSVFKPGTSSLLRTPPNSSSTKTTSKRLRNNESSQEQNTQKKLCVGTQVYQTLGSIGDKNDSENQETYNIQECSQQDIEHFFLEISEISSILDKETHADGNITISKEDRTRLRSAHLKIQERIEIQYAIGF